MPCILGGEAREQIHQLRKILLPVCQLTDYWISSVGFIWSHKAILQLSMQIITLSSISLSHMSFIVQPAPLMTNAPKPKSANILRSGRDPGAAHIAMLQPHGQNSNQEPVTITTDGNSTEY